MERVRPSILKRPIDRRRYKNSESVEATFSREQQELEKKREFREERDRRLLDQLHHTVGQEEKREMLASMQELIQEREAARNRQREHETKQEKDIQSIADEMWLDAQKRTKERAEFVRNICQENENLMHLRENLKTEFARDEVIQDRRRLDNDFTLRFGKSVF